MFFFIRPKFKHVKSIDTLLVQVFVMYKWISQWKFWMRFGRKQKPDASLMPNKQCSGNIVSWASSNETSDYKGMPQANLKWCGQNESKNLFKGVSRGMLPPQPRKNLKPRYLTYFHSFQECIFTFKHYSSPCNSYSFEIHDWPIKYIHVVQAWTQDFKLRDGKLHH